MPFDPSKNRFAQLLAEQADMRVAFRRDMLAAYGKLPVPPEQLRDLCIAFAMGWLGALRKEGQGDAMVRWFNQFGKMREDSWQPDDTWKWWK